MKIYVTGDTHIPIDISKLNMREFPEQKELTREDYVIILGDFGLYWHDDAEHHRWKQWLEEKNFTILWIDGNHENHQWLNSFPVTEWHEGMVHQTAENIIHLMRGECFEIGGKYFLAAGGAQSYDRLCRVADVSWWKEELWSHKEQRKLFFTLDIMKSENKRIDYVLSHTCPRDLLIPMFGISPMDDPDPTTSMLQAVYDDLGSGGFTGWYFGHWHQDKSMGKFHCLYDEIVRIL